MSNSASVQIPNAADTPRLRFSSAMATLAARAVQADQRYRVRRQLQERPDYLLDDIGLTRCQIDGALDHWPRF